MNKIIALGDTHGRTTWKTIVERHKDADKVIFIGDYFDTHEDTTGVEQLQNFQDICEYKKANMDKVVLLVGNHDFHYWPGVEERYSGFQPGMWQVFCFALQDNSKLLQMCYVDENGYIYSHAGFTETFIERRIGSFSEKNVNDVWKYKPLSFCFDHVNDHSGCGDYIGSSCIWVRPRALYSDQIDGLQIVGHTTINKISHPAKSERRGFYTIDALGTSKEYLVITDGEIVIDRV